MPFYCVVRKRGGVAVHLVGKHSACPGKFVEAASFDAALKKTEPRRRKRRVVARKRRRKARR